MACLWQEPWSSGNGTWLMIKRSWVRIPAPYTRWNWHFSHWCVVKKFIGLFEKTKNKWKRVQGWPIFIKMACWAFPFVKWVCEMEYLHVLKSHKSSHTMHFNLTSYLWPLLLNFCLFVDFNGIRTQISDWKVPKHKDQ